jgi:hypothetical protein
MKKRIGYMLVLCAAVALAGCQGEISKPLPDKSDKSQEVLAQSPSLAVSHSIEGNTVYLSFLTKNFTYAPAGEPERRGSEGHVLVWVDNQLTKVYTNNFEASNLSPGLHTFAVELAHNNDTPYANTKITFTIKIK